VQFLFLMNEMIQYLSSFSHAFFFPQSGEVMYSVGERLSQAFEEE